MVPKRVRRVIWYFERLRKWLADHFIPESWKRILIWMRFMVRSPFIAQLKITHRWALQHNSMERPHRAWHTMDLCDFRRYLAFSTFHTAGLFCNSCGLYIRSNVVLLYVLTLQLCRQRRRPWKSFWVNICDMSEFQYIRPLLNTNLLSSIGTFLAKKENFLKLPKNNLKLCLTTLKGMTKVKRNCVSYSLYSN